MSSSVALPEGPHANRAGHPLGPALLGLTGSAATTLAAPRLVGGSVRWWFDPGLGGAEVAVLYTGVAALLGAWIWLWASLGVSARRERTLVTVGALWALPLVVGAPLFSHDVYSYLAQGTLAHLGIDPYDKSPALLAHLGHGRVLDAVSPFWRNTTAPYGPLFLGIVSVIVGVTGSHLVAGVIALRAVDMIGLVLVVICVPRVARRLGSSPERALWLTVLNPLVLLQLVAPAHNDLLMAGLMLAGILLALEDHPLAGIAVCVLAATIKLPALAGVAFIAMAWIRGLGPAPRARLRATCQTVLMAVAVLGAVSLATGLGLGWISSQVFSTPNRVHLAITPATAVGWTLASILHDIGVGASTKNLESACAGVALVAAAALAVDLLRRTRREDLPMRLGLALIAFAIGGPAAWPWYLSWGLVLLAACPPARWSVAIPAVSVVGAVLVKADGILALPISSAPWVLSVYAVGAALAAVAWRRSERERRMPVTPEPVHVLRRPARIR